ncbi:hypothetical protein BJX96DRAFT_157107 [Aspergillus floccosus]
MEARLLRCPFVYSNYQSILTKHARDCWRISFDFYYLKFFTQTNLAMSDLDVAATLDGLSTVPVHIWSIAYFGLSAASLIRTVFTFPTQELQAQLPHVLPVLGFIFASAAFSFFCLRSRLVRRSAEEEKVGALLLIASSALAFVYFQFYHNAFARCFYILALGLVGTYATFVTWHGTANFATICITYGAFALVPAAHASLRPTACTLNLTLYFILFSGMNATGGLLDAWRIPDRFAGLAGNSVSQLLMHICISFAARQFLEKLLAAYISAERGSVLECRGWSW